MKAWLTANNASENVKAGCLHECQCHTISICMYVCMYVCVYVYMYVYAVGDRPVTLPNTPRVMTEMIDM